MLMQQPLSDSELPRSVALVTGTFNEKFEKFKFEKFENFNSERTSQFLTPS